MPFQTSPDAVEALAMNLFKRDHPERVWRRRGGDSFSPAEASASALERKLYCAFARTWLCANPEGARARRTPTLA